MDSKKLSLEELLEVFRKKNISIPIEINMDHHPFMTNSRWVGEDGQRYSSWTIKTPTLTIHTGDGGAKLFQEAFQKEAEKWWKENYGKNSDF